MWRAAVVAGSLAAAAAVLAAGPVLVVRDLLPRVDAIVALASHEWERLPRTASLATDHPRAVVLITVPERPTPQNCYDCAHRREWLIRLGVANARIQTIPLTLPGTYGEAVAAAEHLRGTGLRHVVVVTSPYHTRRARAAFRHALAGSGITVGVEPALATSPARPGRWVLAPYDRAYVAYEWAAIVYYAVRYRVRP